MRRPIYLDAEDRALIAKALIEHARRDEEVLTTIPGGIDDPGGLVLSRRADLARVLADVFEEADEVQLYR
jgi:hypothetical protein